MSFSVRHRKLEAKFDPSPQTGGSNQFLENEGHVGTPKKWALEWFQQWNLIDAGSQLEKRSYTVIFSNLTVCSGARDELVAACAKHSKTGQEGWGLWMRSVECFWNSECFSVWVCWPDSWLIGVKEVVLWLVQRRLVTESMPESLRKGFKRVFQVCRSWQRMRSRIVSVTWWLTAHRQVDEGEKQRVKTTRISGIYQGGVDMRKTWRLISLRSSQNTSKK